MTLHVRRAGPLDAGNLAAVVNAVRPEHGGPVLTRDDVAEWMGRDPSGPWHLVEDDRGELSGFQCLFKANTGDPHSYRIATFTLPGPARLGAGSLLFTATEAAARAAGIALIEAEIGADNPGGLAYYQSRGFEVVGTRHAAARIVMRYEP